MSKSNLYSSLYSKKDSTFPLWATNARMTQTFLLFILLILSRYTIMQKIQQIVPETFLNKRHNEKAYPFINKW